MDKTYFNSGLNAHVHIKEPPCSTCPRHGHCVPKVQCPAHVRSGSYNPACHLDGVVGVCCFTGRSHATESEHRSRASTAINIEDVKVSHRQSRLKLEDWVMTAAELLQHSLMTSVVSHDARAASLGRGGLLNLFAAQELKARQAISEDDLLLGLTENTDGPFCPPQPTCVAPNRYRSIGGECNNPTSSTWGAVLTGYERLLPPDYSDGTWAIRTSTSGAPLPSARTVSSALVLEGSHPHPTHNLMFMQFGQFIAHDISAGVIFTADNGTAISCCMNDGEDFLPPELTHFACAPIAIDADDQFYGQFRRKCINFVRTQVAPAHDCSVGYAKQMNGATHYPDLSHLYGSTEEKLSSLRDAGGLLKVFNDYGRDLPPLTERKECLSAKEGAACFESGDNHGNQIISLTVLHTIFTREHNRVARALSALNPTWDEDRVFWETRRILQAEFQHMIYNEWLPLLLGPQTIKTFALSPSEGYSSSYDPQANPSISAEFSTAAMRFGHSVVDGRITIPSPNMGGIYETISIQELMFQPTRMRLRHFLDRLLIGLSTQPMQIVDPYVTEGLSRYMFHGGNPYGVDLAAINIQRGRDHGVQSYNQYRKLIGLDTFTDFQQFPPNVQVTEEFFISVRKRGQLEEIKKVTLARLICDNRDGIELVTQPPQAFLRADLPGNEPVPCDSTIIPSMDLSKFRED
ncbi:hypothetical protein SFRURICE_013169 [Spodoptera frugiperda]|nr:hypothetical protein SFRURICE_013169 [Spodoptera frugiperda]